MLLTALALLATAVLVGEAWAAQSPRTERVNVGSNGAQDNRGTFDTPSISSTGRFVAFQSGGTKLAGSDTNSADDVFVRDRKNGTTERVSVTSGGKEGHLDSGSPAISADGRFVAFYSFATNLVAGDTNGKRDVFVRDRKTGKTRRISVNSAGQQGNGASDGASVSADGRFVAFWSNATDLVTGDTNNSSDIFVRDRKTSKTERVSVNSGGAQSEAADTTNPSISADGRFVAFESSANNLVGGDRNGETDIFVRDRKAGATQRVSVSSNGEQANGYSEFPSVSADGRFVAFDSVASNLVAGDTNNAKDIFVRDLQTGTTRRVSIASQAAPGNSDSAFASISAHGRFVAFESFANNLVGGDSNNKFDVFVRDRTGHRTVRVSVNSHGAQGNNDSIFPSISADGRFVAFASAASNLVAGDTNGLADDFVRGPLFP